MLHSLNETASLTESVVSWSWEMHTDAPEPQRRRRLSSKDTPNVFQSVKPFLNSCSYQSSWTAAYLLIPPTPALPSLSLFPRPPPQLPRTLLTQTPRGPWGICASSLRQRQSSRRRMRRGSKSSPKTPHNSALKSVLARLSRRLLEVCLPSRCLCWCPSLTFNLDPQQLNSGPARWAWLWSSCHYHTVSSKVILMFYFCLFDLISLNALAPPSHLVLQK